MEIRTQPKIGKKTTNAETYRVSSRPRFFFLFIFFAFYSVNVVIKRSIAHNARNVYYTDSAKTKIQYGLKITVDSLIYPSCLPLLSQIFHSTESCSINYAE